MGYRVGLPIGKLNGATVYDSFAIASEEEQRKAVREAFSTPEQREYNARHTTCPSCKGRGYHMQRLSNGRLVPEQVGCETCLGTGAVPRAL